MCELVVDGQAEQCILNLGPASKAVLGGGGAEEGGAGAAGGGRASVVGGASSSDESPLEESPSLSLELRRGDGERLA